MHYSKYNIFSKIKNSENYYIVNLLSGNADILNHEEAEKVEVIREGGQAADKDFVDELSNKRYILSEEEESKLFRDKYLDFIDDRDKDEIQIFFVPNYSCNFSCPYCYQEKYTPIANVSKEGDEAKKIVDALFRYIQTEFAGRKKYITLFGGEPLLNSPKQKEFIGYFLNLANSCGLETCIVTNGYTLEEYIDIIRLSKIRELQITLDGTEETHNSRRFLKDGSGTFNKIVKGIDACLKSNITVNLRVVIDKDNIENLPDLAKFAIDKGWTKNCLFKSQLGRNYELHHCYRSPEKLFSRLSLYEKLYVLIQNHPQILEFYKPAYSISKFLSENETLPGPLFDSCPACKTEWAFDYTGHIYPCTATVGKKDESLGTFYPEVKLDRKLADSWEKRDVTTISECKDCSVQLACGGGCGSVSKNIKGNICSPDCRPIKELLELGFSTYFKEEVLRCLK